VTKLTSSAIELGRLAFFPAPTVGRSQRFQRGVRDQISEIPNMRCALIALVLLILASPTLAAEPKFPALTGRVVDDAGILDASTTSQLTDMLASHERATGQQLVVVTLASLQGFTIEDYGYQLGRYWGNKVRIEVGYGLEGTLTDAASRTIIENDIVPNFKRGDFNAGVIAGTQSILAVLGGELAPASVAEHTSILAVILPFLPLFVVLLIRIIIAVAQSRIPRAPRAAYSPDYDGAYWGPGVSGQGSGGWGGGGSFGGGGFSGGGGSFGGGGASGSW
jgi:uncharacterized protein